MLTEQVSRTGTTWFFVVYVGLTSELLEILRDGETLSTYLNGAFRKLIINVTILDN